jgi:plastocyanin
MKYAGIVLIVVAVLAGGWYVFSQTKSPAPQDEMPLDTASSTPPGAMETGTVDQPVSTTTESDITINAFNFGFDPKTITVKKGDHVKIAFVNTGGMHDLVIDEFNVRTLRLETGATTTVEFDATLAGTFQYYCSVGNHRAMGMWGNLVVTP